MPSCVYRHCTNYTAKVRERNDISFHALPKDGLMKEKWVNIIRTQRCEVDWMPNNHSTVCSDHFLPNDVYITEKNVRRLNKTAVPVVKREEESGLSSPISLEQVNVPSSIFDTPGIAFLKKRIRKISREKRKLQLNNYNLVRRNKRLKIKIKQLERTVSELQKEKSDCAVD